MAHGKRVKARRSSHRAKKRATTDPEIAQPTNRHLVWRFGKLDHEGQFGWQTLALDQVQELEREIVDFQQAPIYELRKKNWLKFIGADEMTPAGRERLSELNDQENGLWQLHLARHKWRVWGYFEEPEFSFVWWDCEHAVATGRSRHRTP